MCSFALKVLRAYGGAGERLGHSLPLKEVGFSRASHTLQGAQAAEAEAILDGILQRVEKKRNRLSIEAVEVPSLAVFKVRLGNLI